MASPYLEKPRRSLQQALAECGRNPAEVGITEPASVQETHRILEPLRHSLPMTVLVVVVLAIAAAGVVFVNDRANMVADAVDDNIWNSNGVVPASGPNPQALEDDTFADPDAPPVEFGEPGAIE
ncbi:MAG: hypothetical protein RIM72_22625 [Alphaproteobacteria bacterium]